MELRGSATVTKVNGEPRNKANLHCYLVGVRAYLKVVMTGRQLKETSGELVRVCFSISVLVHRFD